MNALTPLGMVSEFPSEIQTFDILPPRGAVELCDTAAPSGIAPEGDAEERKDYFVQRDGETFAGTHLLIDLWGAERLGDPAHIDASLREAALIAGATILHSHFHHFTPNGGVSGVVVLAESHISIHTWPERDFAAVDIFMCGACDPTLSLPILQRAFGPSRMDVDEQRRGRVATRANARPPA